MIFATFQFLSSAVFSSLTSIFASSLILGFLVVGLYYLQILSLWKQVGHIPGPKPIPFLGNALYFVGQNSEIINAMTRLTSLYSSPFRFWLGNRLFFVVYEPEQIKTIVNSPKAIEKENLYKLISPWLGTGLFTAPGEKWKVHRKLIAPTFNPKILESFVEVFAKQSKIMIDQIEDKCNGKEFDVFHYNALCTLDMICETSMGITMKAQTDDTCYFPEAVSRTMEIICTRIFKIWLHPNFIFNLTPSGRKLRKYVEYLHGITEEVIRQKKLKESETAPTIAEVELDKTSQKKTFLELLMDGTKFTDSELREEVDTMLVAGSDTMAQVNSFTMLMLASFPDVQEKVYSELYEIYGDEDPAIRPIEKEDLSRMEYLERVIKETLRLFPIGAFFVRHITDDLDIGPCVMPKGSSVVICTICTHRKEEYWPDSLKFDPDRFRPENSIGRHSYSFIPFSAGPRNCIGLRYAMLAMKTLMATVLRRYKLTKKNIVPVKDIRLKSDILLKTVEPLTIGIERRIPKKV